MPCNQKQQSFIKIKNIFRKKKNFDPWRFCTVFHLHARNFALYVGTDDSKSDFRASSANFRMQCNLQTSLFSSFKYRYQFLHTNEQFLKSRKSRYEKTISSTVSGSQETIISVITFVAKENDEENRRTRQNKVFFFVSRKDWRTVLHSKQNNGSLIFDTF